MKSGFPQDQSALLILLAGALLASCKTSGDLAKGPKYQDPTSDIKTVETTTGNESDEPTLQKYEVVKGDFEDYKARKEAELKVAQEQIRELELKNQKLAEEIQKIRSLGVPQTVIDGGSTLPEGKTGAPLLWDLAKKDIDLGQCEKAISPLNELVKTYPKDAKVLPALLNLGACHYKLTHYEDAVLTFNQAIDKFPKKADLAFAWFGQGVAFSKMKRADDSKLFFEELIRRHPKSAEAKVAQKILSKKEKIPEDIFPIGSPRWSKL
jgi:TolA-binding protein